MSVGKKESPKAAMLPSTTTSPVLSSKSTVAVNSEKEATAVDISTCSATQLADFLTQRRFGGSASQSMDFWRKVQQRMEDQQSGAIITSATPKAPAADWGKALLRTPLETSLMNPRGGKCSIQLYEKGYLVATQVKDASVQLVLPAEVVSHLILFAKPEDYKSLAVVNNKKQVGAHLVLLKLQQDHAIFFQGKPVKEQVCFALPSTKGVGPTGPDGKGIGWMEATDAWREALEECLAHSGLTTCQVDSNQSNAPFLSHQEPNQSSTTGGMPFVKCYHGVQDGVLYPMREGLLFFKPPKFLPRNDLVSIACGRGSGGGQSSSRYVDMVIQQHDSGPALEFTNIQREELGVLNDYIHQVLIPAMKADAQTSRNDAPVASVDDQKTDEDDDTSDDEKDDDSSDDEEDDENYVMEQDCDDDGHSDDDSSSEEDGDDDALMEEDDYAKELTKKNMGAVITSERARRSSGQSKRKSSSSEHVKASVVDGTDVVRSSTGGVNEDDSVVDGDFVVVQGGASSTDSEDEETSPIKKSRHETVSLLK